MAGFETIIGNERTRSYFRHAADSGQISHCYVLGGEDGLGKLMMAKTFAQALLCEAPEGRPCGRCHSCVQSLSGNHPDIRFPGHEKPTVIGVDDVRGGIVEDIQIRPYSGKYKIYLVDEAEKLSVQAQNALLKTIEEPPAYGIVMLLTSNADGLLDTILSRSIRLAMQPVSGEQLEAYLREKQVEKEKIPSLVKFAQGNIGKAMKLAASEDFSRMIGLIMKLLTTADSMSFDSLLEGIGELETYKLDTKDCLAYIRMWYRDVLIYKATSDPNLLIFGNELSVIRRFAARYSYNGIDRILNEIDQTARRLDANVNFQLSMELLWMTIRDGCKA